MTTWYYIRFLAKNEDTPDATRIRSHVVPEELLDLVIQDLVTRDGGEDLEDYEVIDETGVDIDLPGMMITTRPNEDFDGLHISIPCIDLGLIREGFERASKRDPRDGDWFKVHNYRMCLCFTKLQIDTFIAQMKEREPEAARRSDEHMKDWENKVRTL